jgi:hypothetical protein
VLSFAASALALAWLARAPRPASYAVDILPALAVLGVLMCVVVMITTRLAVADVTGGEKGVASGIFETSNHLFGGGVGVAVYAALLAAGGCTAAFATAAGISVLGAISARA